MPRYRKKPAGIPRKPGPPGPPGLAHYPRAFTVRRITEIMALGYPLSRVCQMPGMPTIDLVMKWQRADPSIRRQIQEEWRPRVEIVRSSHGREARIDRCPDRIQLREDRPLDGADDKWPNDSIAQAAKKAMCRSEPRTEWWRVGRADGQRKRRNGGPRAPGTLRRRHPSPGIDVDDEDVRVDEVDGRLQVGSIELGVGNEDRRPSG